MNVAPTTADHLSIAIQIHLEEILEYTPEKKTALYNAFGSWANHIQDIERSTNAVELRAALDELKTACDSLERTDPAELRKFLTALGNVLDFEVLPS